MQANRHHLGLPLALAMQLVERGLEIGEKILAGHPPRAESELEVVGVESIGNDQPRLTGHLHPIGEVVVVGIGVVKRLGLFHH